ncbi:MAG: xanthine dehydrogenase family protein subunit M [Proteobacteria bacterium]|nr:MAG: xanthine dehydrogenase family protein subunit M [Pseudomonadota bacterium]QKK11764.1 MAG: xanthine dehydrogenase family protein subunit M [Pseudomonadota bacterium]
MNQPEIQEYAAPTTVREAVELLARGEATILAGGTDLMVQGESGRVRYQPLLLNVRRIAEMTGVRVEGDQLRLGALTTITELEENPLIQEHLPLLVRAADVFASPQIRNAATVGGNICNASPAGDTLVPLLVLNAEVELAAWDGGTVVTRRLPLQDFFAGPGRTHRQPHELLTAIHVPLPPAGFVAWFEKFGTRPALDISTVSVAIGGVLTDRAFSDVRVAFGSVGPTPYRATATAAALEGKPLDEVTIAAAATAAKEEVHPIDDARASAWYRHELIANLTKKVLRHVTAA